MFGNLFSKNQSGNQMAFPTATDPLVALDIGCRWGFADRFIEHIEEMRLYGFDPDLEECEKLSSKYPHQNIHIVPFGLANKAGEHLMHLTREPACSSMYLPKPLLATNYESLECIELIETELFRAEVLDAWVAAESLQYIDYIKLDTQGSELDILKGAIRTLRNVRIIDIEVEFNPIYEDQPLFSDVDIFLRQHGFMLWRFNTLVHYGTGEQNKVSCGHMRVAYDGHDERVRTRGGQLFWADACYVKQNFSPTNNLARTQEQALRDSKLAKILGLEDLTATCQPLC